MAGKNLLRLLDGGDLRSIGRADQVVVIVLSDPKLFSELMSCCGSENPLIAMRAADAVEKITRNHRDLLRPYKKELLNLMAEAERPELRWHLAVVIPRLSLGTRELQRAAGLLNIYLDDRSSIVKTFALQGLADLAAHHPSIRPEVVETLRRATLSGTPAMKARGRKLLRRFDPSL